MNEYKINPDFELLSDQELIIRINLMFQVSVDGIQNQDVQVYKPLSQIYVLIHELLARHPEPTNQVA
jgi:hypothetical protein